MTAPRTLYWSDSLGEEYVEGEMPREVEHPDQSNLVGSLGTDGLHYPVIDLDFPCRLEPSTTPGHFHLYLDRGIVYEHYDRLLNLLCEIGFVQEGIVHQLGQRGQTHVRQPWVKKPRVAPAGRTVEALI